MPLTKARIDKLNEIGFAWETRWTPAHLAHLSQTIFHDKWMAMYEKLKKFKAKYGHTIVPSTSKEDQSLSGWTQLQRKNMAKRKAGTATLLTDEKVRALDDIGFVWDTVPLNLRAVKIRESSASHFDNVVERLIEFKKVFGHTWGK